MDGRRPADDPRRTRPTRVLRLLRVAAGCALLLAVCGGGCTWKASSGGDDDHECKDLDGDGLCDEDGTVIVIETVEADDDAPWPGVAGPAPGPRDWGDALDAGYDLGGATLEPGSAGEPAVRRVRDVTRVRVVPARDGDAREPSTLEAFTRRVRDANPRLLALPVGAGTLAFDGVTTTRAAVVVSWRQLDASGAPLAGASQDFVFDAAARLLAVENALVVPAP